MCPGSIQSGKLDGGMARNRFLSEELLRLWIVAGVFSNLYGPSLCS